MLQLAHVAMGVPAWLHMAIWIYGYMAIYAVVVYGYTCHDSTCLLLHQVAEGSLSAGNYSKAVSGFARAAALYAHSSSADAPVSAESFMSCSSSEVSDNEITSEFFPLQEATGKADKAPVPDQSWWEEFGEWEGAPKVSHLPLPQHMGCLTQPRLVVGDQIVRLPVARPDAHLPYNSFPGLFNATSMTSMPGKSACKVSAERAFA